MNKRTIQILMSTYNGAECIEKQIESIMTQENVDVYIKIRDDGSKDETLSILKRLKEKWPRKIEIKFGDNIGWKKSFQWLLFNAGNYDYYGFSDQDDVWMEDKCSSCIDLIESDKKNSPKLAHCNALSANPDLSIRDANEFRYPIPHSHKMALCTEYFQGCGMLWNRELMNLINNYKNISEHIAHDFWVGLLGYYFGKIYFIKEPKFFHIRYSKNSSADGRIMLGRFCRLRMFFREQNVYMNPSYDLLYGYKDMLEINDKIFLKKVINYKKSKKDKILILMDKEFKRVSVCSTVFFKLAIIMNKY